MTTTVIIRTHAWPVRVTEKSVTQGEVGHEVNETVTRVPQNSERTLHVHSSRDLLIHEIQPSEEDFEEKGAQDLRKADPETSEQVDEPETSSTSSEQTQESNGEEITDTTQPAEAERGRGSRR